MLRHRIPQCLLRLFILSNANNAAGNDAGRNNDKETTK